MNVLEVLVQSSGLEFESRTELEVLDGANLLLVGQEITQFADAEQLGPLAWRLNEASEAYEVDVLDGTGQVVRTLSSTSPSVVYAAADQTTDFGAPQGAVEVAAYQVSAAVGRGFARRATL